MEEKTALQTILSDEQIKSFQDDTKTLAVQANRFVTEFYPSYLTTEDTVVKLTQVDNFDKLNKMTFYQMCECSIDDVDDMFAFFAMRMQKLFTTAYSIKQPVCYGIVSYNGNTSLMLGVAPAESAENDTIKRVVEGLLPGIKLKECSSCFQNAQDSKKDGEPVAYDKTRYIGSVSGVPALKNQGQYLYKDLSSLMRSLNGSNYTVMVMASPVDNIDIQSKIDLATDIKDQCFQISKRTVSLQQGTSSGTQHSDGESLAEGTFQSKNKNHGMNVSGALPMMAAGAAIGSVIPGVGTVVGAVGGGLIGLFVGKQIGFNMSSGKSKGTSRTKTINYSDSVSESVSQSGTLGLEVQNGYSIELMKMADTMSERLKTGRSIGMWNMAVSYSSDSKIVRDIIQGSIYSEIASGNPDILPPVTFTAEDSHLDKNGNHLKGHATHLLIPNGILDNCKTDLNAISSFVTSEELCGLCTIPTENVPGFEVRKSKSYPLSVTNGDTAGMVLGNICEFDRPIENLHYALSEEDIVKHTFVCGITGSGKTTTVKNILCNSAKPFLVIEPAKKEYRNISKGSVTVYTLGRPEINCLRFNPFYIMPGISPQQHIDFLKDLFNASFSLYGPMPYILEKCLHNIYIKKGWNLTLGFHPYLIDAKNVEEMFGSDVISKCYELQSHRYIFPTMQDLKEEIDYYIDNELTYEGEVKGNIRSAMQARIDSLCVGAKGFMFNTTEMSPFDKILSQNTVFELEGLADDSDKAFTLGLLIIYISEYRQTQKEVSYSEKMGLQHILVIEEAHRLLKNVSNERNEDVGNPKGKAVEHFTNMLAEMRSYGQGVIVAEQIPSKLTPDIIKNSSNKIVHRLVAADDQQAVANTIGINAEDAVYLGRNRVGIALCHKEGMALPVLVKMNQVADNRTSDSTLYRKDLDGKIQQIDQSMISSCDVKSVRCMAVKLLNSLLMNQDIDDGISEYVEEAKSRLRLKSVEELPSAKREANIRDVLAKETVRLLLRGVYSIGTLPDDNVIESVFKCIQIPTLDNQNNLRKLLSELYKPQKMDSVAIDTIGGLLSVEYANGEDITDKVLEFVIVKDEKIPELVTSRLERRKKCR